MSTILTMNLLIFSMIGFFGGVFLRALGHWLRVLKAPANRMIALFAVFALAALYLLATYERPACQRRDAFAVDTPASLTCMYRHLRVPAAQEV